MFCLRIGGTCEFISKIDPDDDTCWPVGSATSVVGWNHPATLKFESESEAKAAADVVLQIEGFPCSVEKI